MHSMSQYIGFRWGQKVVGHNSWVFVNCWWKTFSKSLILILNRMKLQFRFPDVFILGFENWTVCFFVFSSWSDQSLTKTLVDSVNGLGRYRRGRCNVFLCGAVCQRSSFSFVTVSVGCPLRVKTLDGEKPLNRTVCIQWPERLPEGRRTNFTLSELILVN